MPFDLTRCINQRKGCTGAWIECAAQVSADDILQAMEPMCPNMTTEERAGRPLRTIDAVTELTCSECGQRTRRVTYRPMLW